MRTNPGVLYDNPGAPPAGSGGDLQYVFPSSSARPQPAPAARAPDEPPPPPAKAAAAHRCQSHSPYRSLRFIMRGVVCNTNAACSGPRPLNPRAALRRLAAHADRVARPLPREEVGLGRVVAFHHRPPTSYRIPLTESVPLCLRRRCGRAP